MRFVLNTHRDDAGTQVCIHDLAVRLADRGHDARVNDWDGYPRADIAVFMGYDYELDRARKQNPDIRVVLADPKQDSREHIASAREADLLLVSSIEQRDAFLALNRNVLIHAMFPRLSESGVRRHEERSPTVIGYHGNRVHLEAMVESVRPALHALAKRRPIELVAVYNIADLGRARIGVPDEELVPTRHIQWTPGYVGDLADVDIGIVPNELPLRDRLDLLEVSALDRREFKYEPFDHLVRYKASANANRLYAFAELEIPVVTDFAPSLSQFVADGESGFVVSSPHGWFHALDLLAGSVDLRTRMGSALRARVDAEFDAQVDRLVAALEAPVQERPMLMAGWPTPRERLERLPRYVTHKGAGVQGFVDRFRSR